MSMGRSERSLSFENMDVIEWSKAYDGPQFHSLLCDPPYELNFMGSSWDNTGVAFRAETWAALRAHLMPGAFLMAFAGTRGYHRMACAIEDAGLRIHPLVVWVQGQGFPKSTRIDTQIDRDAGAVRDTPTPRLDTDGRCRAKEGSGGVAYATVAMSGGPKPVGSVRSDPATDLARTWEGHRYGGQVLKPSLECVCVAQVPYVGRPVDCITGSGAGALNIAGARVKTAETLGRFNHARDYGTSYVVQRNDGLIDNSGGGRWPANFALACSPDCGDTHAADCPAAELDRQSGWLQSGVLAAGTRRTVGGHVYDLGRGEVGKIAATSDYGGDSGGASRFFYTAKPTREERDAGLAGSPLATRNRVNAGGLENDPKWAPVEVRNPHPTLKPLDLCRWLATLLLPPPDYAPRRLLVPFAGTGSEAIGAILAGWEQVLGIEQSVEYAELARQRAAWWMDGHGLRNDAADAVKPQRGRRGQEALDFDAEAPSQ